ncbi:MAG: hypothetical protein K2H45_07990, partial [Acetatifactor sp.]|nr:hypothetical protein [Acetatifactor sp.]
YQEDISGISKGLAAIPLISNVLPLAALFEAKIYTPVIDRDFYESIPRFMKGYYEMWKGISEQFHFVYDNILVAEIVEKNFIAFEEDAPSMLYFSGGVDAYTSLIRHETERVILLTVCGADTYYNNTKGLETILKKNQKIADMHHMQMLSLTTSLRKFMNESLINDYLIPIIGDNYWHAFQHSVGMLGLSVGYLYKYGIRKIYFASSFSSKDEEKIRCGSDPTIDNEVKIANIDGVSHDLFDLSRQDKIEELISYHERTGLPVNLRVCYRSADGENCCQCEKCLRTIMAILAEGKDPGEFDFHYDPNTIYLRFAQILKGLDDSKVLMRSRYDGIQSKMRKIYPDISQAPEELRLFLASDIEQLCSFLEASIEEEHSKQQDMTAAKRLLEKGTVGYQFFQNCYRENPEELSLLCRKVLPNIPLREPQSSSQWIANHGFMLDASINVEKEGNRLLIHLNKGNVVLQGWAADFQEEQPLAALFIRIGTAYYSAGYGKTNLNLGIKYQNEALINIGFRTELPIDLFADRDNEELHFLMIGFKNDEAYQYPEISFKVQIV